MIIPAAFSRAPYKKERKTEKFYRLSTPRGKNLSTFIDFRLSTFKNFIDFQALTRVHEGTETQNPGALRGLGFFFLGGLMSDFPFWEGVEAVLRRASGQNVTDSNIKRILRGL